MNLENGDVGIDYPKCLPAFTAAEIHVYHPAGAGCHSEKIKWNNNCRFSKIPQSIYWILWALTQKSLSVPGHTQLTLRCSIIPELRITAQKKMFSEGLKVSFSLVFYFITSGFPFNNSVRKPQKRRNNVFYLNISALFLLLLQEASHHPLLVADSAIRAVQFCSVW